MSTSQSDLASRECTGLACARLLPALLLAVFGLGVLLTEYMHVLVSLRPLPENALAVLERYIDGDVVVITIAVLIGPVVEEFLFRGLLLRGLLTLQRSIVAVPVGAAIFAAFHCNIWQLLPAFCMGLLFGWVYVRTRSLATCIVGHMAWNAQWWIAVGLLGAPVRGYGVEYDPGTFPQQPVWWLMVGVVSLLVGILLLRIQFRGLSVAHHNARRNTRADCPA
jgi:uncharacterized protein